MGTQLDLIAVNNIFDFVFDKEDPHCEYVNSFMLVNKKFCAVAVHGMGVHLPCDQQSCAIVHEFYDGYTYSNEMSDAMLDWIISHRHSVFADDKDMFERVNNAFLYCKDVANMIKNDNYSVVRKSTRRFLNGFIALCSIKHISGTSLLSKAVADESRTWPYKFLDLLVVEIPAHKWTLGMLYAIADHPFVACEHKKLAEIRKQIPFDNNYPLNWLQRDTLERIRRDPEVVKLYVDETDIKHLRTNLRAWGFEYEDFIIRQLCPMSSTMWDIFGLYDLDLCLTTNDVKKYLLEGRFEVTRQAVSALKKHIKHFSAKFIMELLNKTDKNGEKWLSFYTLSNIIEEWMEHDIHEGSIPFDKVPFRVLGCFSLGSVRDSGRFTKSNDYLWWSMTNNKKKIGYTRKIARIFDITKESFIEWASEYKWHIVDQYMDRIDKLYDVTVDDKDKF